MANHELQIEKDSANKKLTITRQFDAEPEQVWRAWTEPELLDQWWAPNPWRAETKTLEFREGGYWLYAMVGPDNSRHWARVDFLKIVPNKSFQAIDVFCDESGQPNPDMPTMQWTNSFMVSETGTKVIVEIEFIKEADFNQILAMGFEAGFTAALTNLDRYIETHFRIRKELKPNNQPRVTTYLNFPGNTEAAFSFYKEIFNGKYTGIGLRRFRDIEMPAGAPPLSEVDKNLIIHAELTIMGGHILMATDAPESMGFKLQAGNNMHINLEPASRVETKRIFDALSEGGNVTMPLEDMFFGAYFGTVTDQFGINWMLTFQTVNP